MLQKFMVDLLLIPVEVVLYICIGEANKKQKQEEAPREQEHSKSASGAFDD